MLPNDMSVVFIVTAFFLAAGVVCYFNLRSWAMKAATKPAIWQATRDYSFSVTHRKGKWDWRDGASFFIEYRNSQRNVTIDVGSLTDKPYYVVITQNVDDAIKPVLLPRLQEWLKQGGRNWEVR